MKTFLGCFLASLLFISNTYGQHKFQATYGDPSALDGSNDCDQGENTYFRHYGYSEAIGQGYVDGVVAVTEPDGDLIRYFSYGGDSIDLFIGGMATSDTGDISVGYTISWGAGMNDVFLQKTNSSGSVTWAKAIGGAYEDKGFDVQQTSDGGYIVCGETSLTGQNVDGLAFKTNGSGTVTWWCQPGGALRAERLYAIREFNGGYIAVGETGNLTAGLTDVFVVRINSSGTVVWARSVGGPQNEIAYDVIPADTTDSTDFYITGYSESIVARKREVYVVSMDNSGNLNWAKTYGLKNKDEGRAISLSSDASPQILVAGYTDNSAFGNTESILLKINASNGNLIWTNIYGDSQNDYLNGLVCTSDSGYLMSGLTYSYGAGRGNVWAVKTDLNGQSECHFTDTTFVVDTVDSVRVWTNFGDSTGLEVDSINPGVDSLKIDSILCIDSIPDTSSKWDGRKPNTSGFNFEEPDIEVYPNPSSGQFWIKSQNPIEAVEVRHLTGQLIKSIQLSGSGDEPQPLNLSHLPQGTYILVLKDYENRLSRKTILVW